MDHPSRSNSPITHSAEDGHTRREQVTCSTRNRQRSKKGCQPCRRRKKKCDELHPTCTGCARNYLICQWPSSPPPQSGRRARRRRRHHHLSKGLQLMPGLRDMVTVFTVPSRPMLDRLLSHFTEFGPTWLSIDPGRRRTSFLTYVIPMALQSSVILKCIFAISAADLAKYHTGDYGLDIVALEMHSQALTELNTSINQEIMRDPPLSADTSVSDAVLLAVLLLCLHEAHNYSESSRLLPHLNAAATLSWRYLQQPPLNTELREFLLALFCYFFALASVSHGPSIAKDPASHVFASILARYQQRETEFEKKPLLGQLVHLFWTIFRVSTLAMQTSASPFEDAIRRAELINIESQLQGWEITDLKQPTYEAERDWGFGETSQQWHPCDSSDNDSRYDHRIVFELYRLASVVYVKRTVDPHESLRDPCLQRVIASFITRLDSLPSISLANGILGWPLVIVGICSVVGTHQRVITARLRTIHRTWRSDIFIQNIEFLRRHWDKARSCDKSHGKRGQNTCDPDFDLPFSSSFTFQTLGLPTILV